MASNMKKIFQRFKAKHETKTNKGKTAIAAIGGTGLVAALAPAVGAAPIEFTGQKLDVDIGDVIGTGFNIANMFGPYTVVILAFIIAPVLVGFLIWLFSKIKKHAPGQK